MSTTQTLDLTNFSVTGSTAPGTVANTSTPELEHQVDQFFLFGDLKRGVRIITPLLLSIELDSDGSYVVSDDLFSVYGSGGTKKQAIDDYVVSLIDYYELLSHETQRNSVARPQLHKLQRYLSVDAIQAA